MIKKILKRVMYILLCTCITTQLIACGLMASPNIREEDENLVAEYAAGVLLKYSAKERGGFAELKPEKVSEEPEENIPDNSEPEVAEVISSEPEEPDTEAETVVSSVTDMSMVTKGSSIADAIGIPGFDINYTGYEVADVYPPNRENALSFSMQAAAGKKLLVVHFDVLNQTNEDKMCDVLGCNVKFRVLINEEQRINEQMTILLNDLKSYSDTIPAGNKVDTVLVFEIDDNISESINSLALISVTADGESKFEL